MLSNVERKYLSGKIMTRSYSYVLEHRIRKKLTQFYRLELPLILQNSNLAEFCMILLEGDKLRAGSEPATFTLPR